MPKERFEATGLTMNISYDYVAHRDSGAIIIQGNHDYDHIVGADGSYSGMPSGCYLSGVTLIDTPFFGPRGINYIDNIKIISPWSYNTDGAFTIADRLRRTQYIRDSFYFLADDCIYAPYNMRSAADPTGAYPLQGGEAVFSGLILYSQSNGPMALSYAPRYYYDVTSNKSYSSIIHNCDIGLYSLNRPSVETPIRMTMGYSVTSYLGTPLDPKNYGLYDLTVSNIRIEEPIDGRLFWIGSEYDPFLATMQAPQGFLFGAISGITIADIDVSSSNTNNVLSSNIIWGYDLSSRPTNIAFKNIKINGEYITNANRDNFIDWVSGVGTTGGYTDPDDQGVNITFTT